MKTILYTLALASVTISTPALAHHHHHHHRHRGHPHRVSTGDPRPYAWCGWYMRHRLHVADLKYNLAQEWRRYGSPASGPCIGCLAVWWHHVGLVRGIPGPGRIVLESGNDGHAVRVRERSSRGVIAWRRPPSVFAGAW